MMAHASHSMEQPGKPGKPSYLSRFQASNVLDTLASQYGRSEKDVVQALKCCNGHVYTAACLLSHWKLFQEFVAQATARVSQHNANVQSAALSRSSSGSPDLPLSLPIAEAELPLRCRSTGELVWISNRVDRLFGKKEGNCADKAVTAVATSDASNRDGASVAASEAMPFYRKRVAISEIIARLEFLMEGSTAKKKTTGTTAPRQ